MLDHDVHAYNYVMIVLALYSAALEMEHIENQKKQNQMFTEPCLACRRALA